MDESNVLGRQRFIDGVELAAVQRLVQGLPGGRVIHEARLSQAEQHVREVAATGMLTTPRFLEGEQGLSQPLVCHLCNQQTATRNVHPPLSSERAKQDFLAAPYTLQMLKINNAVSYIFIFLFCP